MHSRGRILNKVPLEVTKVVAPARLQASPKLANSLIYCSRSFSFTSKKKSNSTAGEKGTQKSGADDGSMFTPAYFKDMLKSGYNSLYYSQYAFLNLSTPSFESPHHILEDIQAASKFCDKIYEIESLEEALTCDYGNLFGEKSDKKRKILLCENISLGQDGQPDCIAYLVSGSTSKSSGMDFKSAIMSSIPSFFRSTSSSSTASLETENRPNHELPTVWIVNRGTHTRNDVFHDISWLATTFKLQNIEFPAGITYRVSNYRKPLENFFSKVDNFLSSKKTEDSALIDNNNKYRVVFCGHSLGGAVATALYFDYISTKLGRDRSFVDLMGGQCSQLEESNDRGSQVNSSWSDSKNSSNNCGNMIQLRSNAARFRCRETSISCLPLVITFGAPLTIYNSPDYFEVPISYNATIFKDILKSSISSVDDKIKNYSKIANSVASTVVKKATGNIDNNIIDNKSQDDRNLHNISTSINSIAKILMDQTEKYRKENPVEAQVNLSQETSSPSINKDSLKNMLQPKISIDMRLLSSRIHNVVYQFDVVPRFVGSHSLPAVIKSSLAGKYAEKLLSLGAAKRELYEPFGYYYALLSKGPVLRKIADIGVCDSRLDSTSTSNSNNEEAQQTTAEEQSMATVKRFLSSFPDGTSSLAFAILNDHSMTNISNTIGESMPKNK